MFANRAALNPIHVALGAALFFGAASPSLGQEWTRFRGPNGSGHGNSASLPVKVGKEQTLWRVALPGTGHSSPVLWGGKLFVTSAEESKGKRHLLCIDAKTGRALWTKSYDFTKYGTHEFNSAASSTPTVDDKRVYSVWPSPQACLVIASTHEGKELWRRDLGKVLADHGGAASPVVHRGVLMLGIYQEHDDAPGFIAGLDAETGQVRWKLPRGANKSSAYSTPIVVRTGNGTDEAVFTSTAHGMTALDPASGKVLWETTGLFGFRCVASPIQSGDILFATAGAGSGVKQAVAVSASSARSKSASSVQYRMDRGPSYSPTPIAVGDKIFAWGDGGIVHCLKAQTGETVWSERVGGNFFSSPVLVDGKLYNLSAKGELVVIDASDKFKLLGTSDLGEATHASPAVANNRMYVRTLSHLLCIGQSK